MGIEGTLDGVMVPTSVQGREQILCPIAAKLGDIVLEHVGFQYGSWLENYWPGS